MNVWGVLRGVGAGVGLWREVAFRLSFRHLEHAAKPNVFRPFGHGLGTPGPLCVARSVPLPAHSFPTFGSYPAIGGMPYTPLQLTS